MNKVILIDNYDSFTYNLFQLLEEEGAEVTVRRNDRFRLEELEPFDKIVLSPGPGIPDEAGLLESVIRRYAATKPMLGVCLGEQAIGEVFGARLYNLPQVFHGVQTPVQVVADDPLFRQLPLSFPVGRYHSWVVSSEGLPDCLEVTARSPEGHIMALRHKTYDVHGIQFHPESILTPCGRQIIQNFLS
ncbi:MAG: anthranilate synthase component II [Alloprevotella sp.]